MLCLGTDATSQDAPVENDFRDASPRTNRGTVENRTALPMRLANLKT